MASFKCFKTHKRPTRVKKIKDRDNNAQCVVKKVEGCGGREIKKNLYTNLESFQFVSRMLRKT